MAGNDNNMRVPLNDVPAGIVIPLPDIPGGYQGRMKQFFMYEFDQVPLTGTAGLVATVPIQIDADSDFIAFAGVLAASDAAEAVNTFPAVKVQLTSSGSGRIFSNVPVHIKNMFGTGERPAYWPYALYLSSNSVVQLQFTNIIATLVNLRAALWGFKLYSRAASAGY